MEHEFERNARTAEAEQSKRAASRVKPTEPDRAGKQSAQRSVGDVERELRGIDEAVKSRTSEGRAEQAERRRAEKVIGDRFGLIPPISFYGKSHTKENAHELFAVVVDVDYVGKQQLKNRLKQFGNGVQLRPTYLVSSGKGVHLYYFLQEPVQLYRNREEVLAELKEAFIRRLWNDTSSIRPDSPDITGIYQGFRCVGSQSKLGVDFPVKAYKLSENRYTLEDIKASIPSCKVDLAPLYEKPRRKSTVTLEEAKELYPEWYEKRIVQGEPKQKSKKQGGTWVCNEALYEWWKRKITEEVKAGGRYFSIMALCSYGLKCGISEQKIRRDAYAFLDHLESLTEDEDNHFSRADVKDGIKKPKMIYFYGILKY
ncbi:Rep (plasmid) [Campylobacter jejuni]|nr:Rep [Campylobacter jejuni]